MALDLKTYNRLKTAVDAKQKEADQCQGAFDLAMKQLKTDFDCDTIEEAKAKLARLEEKETAAKEAFEAKLTEFQKEWGHVISVT